MKDKPTHEEYYPTGTIYSQLWKKNGKLHRTNELPAWISYHENGNIKYQSWLKDGQHHRTNGLPANIWYFKDGNIECQQWWVNGIELSDKEVLQRQYQFFNKVMDSINNEGTQL